MGTHNNLIKETWSQNLKRYQFHQNISSQVLFFHSYWPIIKHKRKQSPNIQGINCQYLSYLQVAKNIVNSLHRQGTNTGKLRSLFQEMGPAMADQIIMNAVMFSVFHQVKDIAAKGSIMLSNKNDTCGCKSNDNG